MLGIEKRLASPFLGQRHALGDHGQVFGPLDPKGDVDLEIPGLAEDAGGIGLGVDDGGQRRVIGRGTPGPARHAKSNEASLGIAWRRVEKGIVRRVGAGPATFDIVDPKGVECLGDGDLIGYGEIHALCLRAVTKRRVEEVHVIVTGRRPALLAHESACLSGTAGVLTTRCRQGQCPGAKDRVLQATGGQRAPSSVSAKS